MVEINKTSTYVIVSFEPPGPGLYISSDPDKEEQG